MIRRTRNEENKTNYKKLSWSVNWTKCDGKQTKNN